MAVGTISGWLTLAALIGVGWIMFRGGTGTAVSGLQATNTELVRQIHDLKEENTELKRRVAKLELETNVSAAIEPVLMALKSHELHAAERSKQSLIVLDLIARRLGPEPTAA